MDILKQYKDSLREITIDRFPCEYYDLDINVFLDLFKQVAKENYGFDYVLNSENEDFLLQVFYWFFNQKGFNGDLNKGLYIKGKVGRGKSITMLIMNVIAKWYKRSVNRNYNKVFTYYDVLEISDGYKNNEKYEVSENGINLYNDVGREGSRSEDAPKYEDKVFLLYGQQVNIFSKLIEKEYLKFQKSGVPTIIVSNYPSEYMKAWYGVEIYSRFCQMFNVLEIKGGDWRKISSK